MLEIEKHFSKLAKKLGFRQEGEKGHDSMQEQQVLLNKDTKGATILANSLLYAHYDDASGVAFNNGTIGCWFEIDPLVGSNREIEKNLTLFFNEELPEHGYLQFLIVASHDISNILDLWQGGRKYGGNAIDRLTAYRRNFMENNAIDFKNAADGRLARNYRTFICYTNNSNEKGNVGELIRFKRKLENKLKAESLYPRKCKAKDLIQIGRDILQMRPNLNDQEVPKYSILNNLSDQILEPFTPNTVEDDMILHHKTGLVSKIYAPKELPESYSLAQMIELLGNENKVIPARFVISYCLANNLGAKGTSAIKAQGDRAIHAASKEYTKDDILARQEADQWRQVKALHKQGEVFLQESMLVMITAGEDDIDIAEEMLKSLYNANDWKLTLCKKIQRIAALSMLPMMPASYWKSLKFFRLTRNALSGEVVAKLPVQGEWKGVPASGALLIGRRGQLFNFNPFYRIGGGGNYNICMMAPSGSGKSFFLQELAQSMIAQDVAVFIIDIGGSYKNICKLLSGEMVRFNKENTISLNPFAALSSSGAIYAKALELLAKNQTISEISTITGLSEEKIEALQIGRGNLDEIEKNYNAIEVLEIKGSNADDGKERLHFVTKDGMIYAKSLLAVMAKVSGDARLEGVIERAIREGVAKYGRDLDITRMALILEGLTDSQNKQIEGASAIADSLYPYTENGMHGRFFARGDEASFKELLTVFELEDIKADENLVCVVLQVILMQITMQFLCGDRSKRFMLIVDEAWYLLKHGAYFLESFARTVRKYGGSLVVCTQDLSGFSGDASREAVLESSTWELILAQKAKGLEKFAASDAYKPYLGLIASVRKCPANKFSEVLISTDGAKIVGRFASDPYSTALFSTEDKDYAFLQELERQGVNAEDAILQLAKKYGTVPDITELEEED